MNKKMIALALACSAVGYISGAIFQGDVDQLKAHLSNDASRTVSASEELLQSTIEADLKNKISVLESQLAMADVTCELENDASTNTPQDQNSATEQAVETIEADTEIEILKQDVAMNGHTESFSDWLEDQEEKNTEFDLGKEMQTRFSSEEVDHVWAIEQESFFQNMFVEEELLFSVPLKSATCKTHQCQLTIGVSDLALAKKTILTVAQSLGADTASEMIVDTRLEDSEVILYVARHEQGFEAQLIFLMLNYPKGLRIRNLLVNNVVRLIWVYCQLGIVCRQHNNKL